MKKHTCSVPECARPHMARGYCQGHYLRVKKNGDPSAHIPLGEPLNPKRCGVEGCCLPYFSTGYCSPHRSRLKNYGDVFAEIPIGQSVRKPKPEVPCDVEGCDRVARERGYCKSHYQRLWRTGDVNADTPLEREPTPPCSVPFCERKSVSLGYCDGHYQRYKKTGSLRSDVPLREKFGITVEVCEVEGCRGEPKARNMCSKHYARWAKNGSPTTLIRNMDHGGTCELEGCNRPYRTRGMCGYHYRQQQDRIHWKRVREQGHRRRVTLRAGFISDRDLDRILDAPCMACGSRDRIQIDHLIPVSRGGRHTIGNLVPLCGSCNNSKHNLTWAEWKHSSRPRSLLVFERSVN